MDFISYLLKLFVPNEVGLVVIGLELLEQSFEFQLVKVLVSLSVEKGLHLIKVSGVEPRSEEGLLNCKSLLIFLDFAVGCETADMLM